jgi:transcriptional regulator GlxA family with amidase domain
MAPADSRRHFGMSLKGINQPYGRTDIPSGPQADGCRKIAVVVLEHFSMMAFTGSLDALVTANYLSQTPRYEINTYSLKGGQVRSDLGIAIATDLPVDKLSVAGLDMLIVCGGLRTALTPAPALIKKLRQASRQSVLLGSLWNGCFQLAHAGLLDQRECTVHPESQASLHELCPGVRLRPQPFVITGDLVSCAGANSALGMMLAIIRRQQGAELVKGIEAILSCDRGAYAEDMPLARGGRDPAFPPQLSSLIELMENNLEDPLELDELARYVDLSRRQIERLFQTFLHSSPRRHYLELRLTRARRLLLQGNASVVEVAMACGFISSHHFSRCFRDYFGYTASQARSRQRIASDASLSQQASTKEPDR